jgi:DNA polymerase III subunit delta
MGKNVHIFIGEDDFLLAEKAKAIIGDGTGLEVIDSLTSTNMDKQLADIRQADTSFRTPSFLDPRKVTWWKNVNFLPGGGAKKSEGDEPKEKLSEDVKAALEKFAARLAAANLPDNQHFILSGAKLLGTSIIAKTLKKSTDFVQFASETPWNAAANAVQRAQDFAAELGLSFEGNAAQEFAARVGSDPRSLKSELEKMRDYLGAERTTISAKDIAEITSQGVGTEPVIWDVTDAIGARNLPAALSAIKRFEGDKAFAILMTTVIEKFFRQLVEMKAAQADGVLNEVLKSMNPYAARKNEGFLRNWTLTELRVARNRFLDLREKTVSSSGSNEERVVIELARALSIRRA